MADKAALRAAVESARAALMVVHSAAAISLQSSKQASRLLRAAEGLVRSALVTLGERASSIGLDAANAAVGSAAATVQPKEAKKKRKHRKQKKGRGTAGDVDMYPGDGGPTSTTAVPPNSSSGLAPSSSSGAPAPSTVEVAQAVKGQGRNSTAGVRKFVLGDRVTAVAGQASGCVGRIVSREGAFALIDTLDGNTVKVRLKHLQLNPEELDHSEKVRQHNIDMAKAQLLERADLLQVRLASVAALPPEEQGEALKQLAPEMEALQTMTLGGC